MTTIRREICRAAVLGMSQEARDAEERLLRRLESGPVTLLGAPGPHRALLDRARRRGALEGHAEDEIAPTRTLAVPMSGIAPVRRRAWTAAGHELLDLSLPAVKRLHAMVMLMRAESRRIVVAGFRDDPECQALAGAGVTVVEDADGAASLPFSPRRALLAQTTIGERRLATIELALRLRHPDSDLTVTDTRCAALRRRERAVVELARRCDLVLVLADAADRSGQAVYEAARCAGVAAARVSDPERLPELGAAGRIGIAAGCFTPAPEIDALEDRLRQP